MLLSKKRDLELEVEHKTEFRNKQTASMERMISLQEEEIRQSSLEIEVLENSLRTLLRTLETNKLVFPCHLSNLSNQINSIRAIFFLIQYVL